MTKPSMDEAFLTALASSSALLGVLFLRKPQEVETRAIIAELRGSSLGTWPFGNQKDVAYAQQLIQDHFTDKDRISAEAALTDDYQQLFVGPFALAAPPWGSVYLDYEGVICGASTAEFRDWMLAHGITSGVAHNEPEDHIGLMFSLLSWLATNQSSLIPEFLEKHFCTWSLHFCDLMQQKAGTSFYQGVALLSRATLQALVNELEVSAVEPKFYR